MKIPDHVIDEARASLDSPVVRDFLSDVCRVHGIDPDLSPVYFTGKPLFVYRTLYAANEHARSGQPWRNPYPDPESTMLAALMDDCLTASERMRVRTSPPHLRMEVAQEIIAQKDCEKA
jgi:hypothetical protein